MHSSSPDLQAVYRRFLRALFAVPSTTGGLMSTRGIGSGRGRDRDRDSKVDTENVSGVNGLVGNGHEGDLEGKGLDQIDGGEEERSISSTTEDAIAETVDDIRAHDPGNTRHLRRIPTTILQAWLEGRVVITGNKTTTLMKKS